MALIIDSSSSLLLSSLELSDTQSLCALIRSPPQNRCTSWTLNNPAAGLSAIMTKKKKKKKKKKKEEERSARRDLELFLDHRDLCLRRLLLV